MDDRLSDPETPMPCVLERSATAASIISARKRQQPLGEAEELLSLSGRNDQASLALKDRNAQLFLVELRDSQGDRRLVVFNILPQRKSAQLATHVNVVSFQKSTIVAPPGENWIIINYQTQFDIAIDTMLAEIG